MILYEVLNEQPDVLAERTYAVWPDLEALMREHGVPAVHRRRAPPARRVRPARASASPPSSATRTCSPRSTSPVSRCTPSTAPTSTRSWSPAGTPRSTRSRSPTSSTPRCSATARRRSLEITDVVRDWKARGPPRRPRRAADPAGRDRRRATCPRSTTSSYPPDGAHRRGRARPATGCPARSPSAPRWTSTPGRTRSSRWCRWPRACTSG